MVWLIEKISVELLTGTVSPCNLTKCMPLQIDVLEVAIIYMTYLMKYVYVWKEENVIQINGGITTNVDVSVTES